jgi:hypothetical protein
MPAQEKTLTHGHSITRGRKDNLEVNRKDLFQRKIAVHIEDDALTSYEIFIKYLKHSLPC